MVNHSLYHTFVYPSPFFATHSSTPLPLSHIRRLFTSLPPYVTYSFYSPSQTNSLAFKNIKSQSYKRNLVLNSSKLLKIALL